MKKVPYVNGVPQVRPWVRFWARMIDIILFYILFFGLFFFLLITATPLVLALTRIGFFWSILSAFGYILIESYLISSFGTTPGKWLLKITVRDKNNHKLTFEQAFQRSVYVWWRGLGTGIFPPITIITMLVAYYKLEKYGITSWDKDMCIKIVHGKF